MQKRLGHRSFSILMMPSQTIGSASDSHGVSVLADLISVFMIPVLVNYYLSKNIKEPTVDRPAGSGPKVEHHEAEKRESQVDHSV